MRESGQAALSYARSRARALGLDKWFYRDSTCTCTCPRARSRRTAPRPASPSRRRWCRALTGVPTRADVAMTGEITLRGNVLPIGGLNEKVVAARAPASRPSSFPGRTRRT